MSNRTNRWARRAAFAAFLVTMTAAVASAAEPGRLVVSGGEITETDVARSNTKLSSAYGSLAKMWDDKFHGIGRRFVTPRLIRHRGGARTPCGTMGSGQ